MRIGIVTFFGPYGGALQCYALQHILRSLGHDVKVINRKWGKFRPLEKRTWLQNIKHQIKEIVAPDPFNKFYNQYYEFTQPITSNEILQEIGTKKFFDVIIAGSDQPWNPECISTMGYYFYLDWVSPDVKKYAYAVSYGKDYFPASAEEIKKIKAILQQYTAISVRESSGIKISQELFNVNVQQCLDPTLLLDKENYNKIITDKKIRDKYICKFFLDNNPTKQNIVESIAHETNLKIIDNNPVFPRNKFLKFIYQPISISAWLRNIRDAQYVITDSFHGTVFSILFHKQFISINNKKRGSARFESLLSVLNLSYRLINEDNLTPTNICKILHKQIDYKTIDSKLKSLRIESIYFIQKLHE